MRNGLLALAAGLLLLRFIPQLPPASMLLVSGLVGLALLPFRTYPIGLFLLGFSWACTSAQWALDDRLDPALDGRTLWLEGRVVDLPDVREGVVRFHLQQPQSRRAQLPQLLRLSWYGGPDIRAGETWRLAVNLKRPHGLVNPQSFDYEAWLLAQRIGGVGTIKSGQRLSEAGGSGAWRDGLRQRMLAEDPHGRAGGLAALVLGDGSGLSVADWRVLQDTGTVHLLVISGQHVTLVAGMFYGLVFWLARLGWWPRVVPWLPTACILAFSSALGYSLLAGFEVPVQRACAMIGLVLLWRWRFRHLGITLPLLVALVTVLLLEPLAVLQPGFWLSFGAVGLLILIFAARLGAWAWWRTLGRAQWAMTVGLLPMLLALGLPISASSPLANLIAVPWVGFAVVPPALLGTLLLPVPWLGEALLWWAGFALEWLFRLLALMAAWLPAWLPSALPLWAWLLVALGALLILLPSGVPLRGLGLILLLPLLFAPVQRPAEQRAEVWMLDVGQGLSMLVLTGEHALLYDAGPSFGDFDMGERVVLPSLRALDVRALDMLLLSHSDNDHSGGAEAVARGIPVSRVVSGEAPALPAVLQAEPCREESWTWNGVHFSTWRWADATDSNQSSCVLMIEAAGERILLTGDIDGRAERALIDTGRDLQAQWLLAPHHGSRSSSSWALLKAVTPEAVLYSRGRHNAYGHPHPAVVSRYAAFNARAYDSVETGALRIDLGTFGEPHALREIARFWREK
ncbi:DNA internalization-related competence protein ComEC/Rec2 [Pseudomonas sp. MM211]|uniref:DNA internalization-related competence protein ComEC/Rec2 n=1 Tax=Pseudomonas sp. MM211 TaxID=2866808 RepID=UPI001CED6981|nr:DNA internalization-related competence protein ComEC/Rec2 [Pseudomonas sp. MM211]UCJ19212.1 DNA internalization-related competence protein ComEC/Rec2 [Pseudomonas sp. MM211]